MVAHQIFWVLSFIILTGSASFFRPTPKWSSFNKTLNFEKSIELSKRLELEEDVIEGDIYIRHSEKSNVRQGLRETVYWPNGIIIYRLDEQIGCPHSDFCKQLEQAFDYYHAHSCIRFQEWTGQEDFIFIFLNPDSGRCASHVGKMGNRQVVSLGLYCWSFGIILHELLHAIGFLHEMSRYDRDNYITINLNNVQTDSRHNFVKSSVESDPDDPFDPNSIMMYGSHEFSIEPQIPVIVTKDNSILLPPDKKTSLSETDKRRIERKYQCDRSQPLGGLPYDISCSFQTHDCGLKGKQWQWETGNKGFIYTHAETAHVTSVNFYGKPVAPNLWAEGCLRFDYKIEANEGAHLNLKQSFVSSPTKLGISSRRSQIIWESINNTENDWVAQQVRLYVNNPFKLIFTAHANGGRVSLDNFELLFNPCQ